MLSWCGANNAANRSYKHLQTSTNIYKQNHEREAKTIRATTFQELESKVQYLIKPIPRRLLKYQHLESACFLRKVQRTRTKALPLVFASERLDFHLPVPATDGSWNNTVQGPYKSFLSLDCHTRDFWRPDWSRDKPNWFQISLISYKAHIIHIP